MPLDTKKTLSAWIKETFDNNNEIKLRDILKIRGYADTDFEQSMAKWINFSPRLLLNSLYESLLEIGITDEDAAMHLKPIAEIHDKMEKQQTAPAH